MQFFGPVRSTRSPINVMALSLCVHDTERQCVGILRAALEVEYLMYINQPTLPQSALE